MEKINAKTPSDLDLFVYIDCNEAIGFLVEEISCIWPLIQGSMIKNYLLSLQLIYMFRKQQSLKRPTVDH